MGEHKRNPRIVMAENGELPPRTKKLSKKQINKEIEDTIAEVFF